MLVESAGECWWRVLGSAAAGAAAERALALHGLHQSAGLGWEGWVLGTAAAAAAAVVQAMACLGPLEAPLVSCSWLSVAPCRDGAAEAGEAAGKGGAAQTCHWAGGHRPATHTMWIVRTNSQCTPLQLDLGLWQFKKGRWCYCSKVQQRLLLCHAYLERRLFFGSRYQGGCCGP